MESTYTWIWRIGIGLFIVLLGYVWRVQDNRIKHLEDKQEKDMEKKYLTEDVHEVVCTKAMSNLKDWLEVKFELIDQKMETKIVRELEKLNGKS